MAAWRARNCWRTRISSVLPQHAHLQASVQTRPAAKHVQVRIRQPLFLQPQPFAPPAAGGLH